MELHQDDVLRLFLALGLLLGAARAGGAAARRLGQPGVLGEIGAGILLGPTVLGRLAPDAQAFLFPREGAAAVAFTALSALAVNLFLMASGMELSVSSALRRGREMLLVAAGGIAAPFALGWLAGGWIARLAPEAAGVEPGIARLFLATALSISALPVIARTLMDLRIDRTDFGVTVIGAAVLNDLAGWLCFAGVLAHVAGDAAGGPSTGARVISTLAFTAGMLVLARPVIHRVLPLVLARQRAAGAVLALTLCITLLSGAATTWLGVHALFGSFLAGVAVGDSAHLRETTRSSVREFVSSFFAPVFFGGIGLTVDFVAHFDLALCAVVLAVACAGKIAGCGLAARAGGSPWREALAFGVAMNARGSMEIVLGLSALKAGLIGEPLFVALVVMALATSAAGGPLLKRLAADLSPPRLGDHLFAFVPRLSGRGRRAAIRELCRAVAPRVGRDAAELEALAWTRERAAATGVGDGVALPHARVPGLERPALAAGLAPEGVDFDASDGLPARLVVLALTPEEDPRAQLAVGAALARALLEPGAREQALAAPSLEALRDVLDGRA